MTWFEKLYENPLYLAKFCKQLSDSYCWNDNKFSLCMDDLPIIEELGLKRRLGCPCMEFLDDSIEPDCCECEARFLFDPLIYDLMTKEKKDD